MEHLVGGARGGGRELTSSPSDHPGRTLARGIKRSCPVCGNRRIFARYFRLLDSCSRCGYVFAREEGYWVGAVIVNTAASMALFLVVFLASVIVMAPDIDWLVLLAVGVAVNLVFPVLFYPFSKTIWMAFDLVFMKRLER